MNLRWDPDGPARGRVVLLHGVMSTASTWWRIGPALAVRDWRVVALDLPGHGAWPRSERPLDLDILVQGIADQLPEPVDLVVGHSLGAAVSVVLAGRRPEVARALVLEDPPGSLGDDRAAFAAGIAADARMVRSDREQLVRRERQANPSWAPEDVEHSVDGIAAADAPSIVAGFHGGLEWDMPAMLAAVKVPVLLLAAGQPERSALQEPDREAVRAQLPPNRFVVLDGGHCLHRDLPDRWLAAVTGFADATLA
jgi:pimeloyl-ACP methyl ester carboxylesterase